MGRPRDLGLVVVVVVVVFLKRLVAVAVVGMGMVVGVVAFVTVQVLLWERSTRIELCYRPLNPRGGGRRTKPCDHTAP